MSMVNYLIFCWKDSKKNWRAGSQTWVRCLGPRCMSSDSKVPSVSGRMVFLSRLKDLPGAGSLATHTGLKPVYLSGVQIFTLKKGKKLLSWLKVSKSQKQFMVSSILPKIKCWDNFMCWKLYQHWYFGRIEDTIICFRDCLTFKKVHNILFYSNHFRGYCRIF